MKRNRKLYLIRHHIDSMVYYGHTYMNIY